MKIATRAGSLVLLLTMGIACGGSDSAAVDFGADAALGDASAKDAKGAGGGGGRALDASLDGQQTGGASGLGGTRIDDGSALMNEAATGDAAGTGTGSTDGAGGGFDDASAGFADGAAESGGGVISCGVFNALARTERLLFGLVRWDVSHLCFGCG